MYWRSRYDRALLVEIVEWLGTTVKHPKLYKSDPVKEFEYQKEMRNLDL